MDLLAEKVVELIEEFDIADRVVIESGSSRIIKKVIEAGGGKDKEFLVFQDFIIPISYPKWRWASPEVDGIAIVQYFVKNRHINSIHRNGAYFGAFDEIYDNWDEVFQKYKGDIEFFFSWDPLNAMDQRDLRRWE